MAKYNIIEGMHDIGVQKPDHRSLFEHASEWRGYFTTRQARACGFSANLLNHYVKSGRFLRIHRGLYRFRDYPTMPHDEVVEAVLKVGAENAVVSHESALDLLELSDIIPNAIHLTVPRSKRYVSAPRGVRLHTRSRPLDQRDVITRDGVRLTSATRSILDSLEIGSAPDQIERAIVEAIDRGLATQQDLEGQAAERGRKVERFVRRTLESWKDAFRG